MAKIHPMIHPVLIPIIDYYPESRETVSNLFRENESFREICLDCERCRKSLFYWKMQNNEEGILRIAEYEEILHSLEQELMGYFFEYGITEKCPRHE